MHSGREFHILIPVGARLSHRERRSTMQDGHPVGALGRVAIVLGVIGTVALADDFAPRPTSGNCRTPCIRR